MTKGSIEVHHRVCHLCEAMCGLVIKTERSKVVDIRGDQDDPLSRGHVCPKAISLQDIHEDPVRLHELVGHGAEVANTSMRRSSGLKP